MAQVLGDLTNKQILLAPVPAGGWAFHLVTLSPEGEADAINLVGVAVDDEGAMEWLGEQLALDTPRHDPGAHVLSRDRFWALNRYLMPFAVALGRLGYWDGGSSLPHALREEGSELTVHDLRALIAAATDGDLLPKSSLQTRPPNPGSEAKPAEHGAPPVVADLVALATPYVAVVIAGRNLDDMETCGIKQGPSGKFGSVQIGHHRALIRAAGLWTSEMEPLHRSDDDTGADGDDTADADAPVRASASVGDASPAGAPRTDDQSQAQPPRSAEEPEAAQAPPPPAKAAFDSDTNRDVPPKICPVCDMPANGHTHPQDEEEIPF